MNVENSIERRAIDRAPFANNAKITAHDVQVSGRAVVLAVSFICKSIHAGPENDYIFSTSAGRGLYRSAKTLHPGDISRLPYDKNPRGSGRIDQPGHGEEPNDEEPNPVADTLFAR
jgi:hypothetical protein